jgi:hypothetical protein
MLGKGKYAGNRDWRAVKAITFYFSPNFFKSSTGGIESRRKRTPTKQKTAATLPDLAQK